MHTRVIASCPCILVSVSQPARAANGCVSKVLKKHLRTNIEHPISGFKAYY